MFENMLTLKQENIKCRIEEVLHRVEGVLKGSLVIGFTLILRNHGPYAFTESEKMLEKIYYDEEVDHHDFNVVCLKIIQNQKMGIELPIRRNKDKIYCSINPGSYPYPWLEKYGNKNLFEEEYLMEPVQINPEDIDCNGCFDLNISEEKQEELHRAISMTQRSKYPSTEYRCLRYNIRLFHNSSGKKHSSRIRPCDECIEQLRKEGVFKKGGEVV